MKTGHEYQLSTSQQLQAVKLLPHCKEVHCFELEGMIFAGEKVEVVKRYVSLNPSKSFYVWCHDNLPILEKFTSNIKT